MNTAAPLQRNTAKSPLVSNSSHAGLLLQRKCACGSPKSALTGECEECKGKKRLQTKLSIGASNDPLEQEADRVAEQVMAAPLHSAVSGAKPSIQRFTGQSTGDAGTAPASVDRALSGSGGPLDPAIQQDMEQRFGHDFSQVRVHTSLAAEQSAQEVSAHAYTVGHNIVFGKDRFAPKSHEGRKLIAHELTHVVQQNIGRFAGIQKQAEIDDGEERVENEVEIMTDEVPAPADEIAGDDTITDETLPVPADTPKKAQPKKKPARKSKAPPNPCTRIILSEGTCEFLVRNSKWVCCDPDKGIEDKERKNSAAEPGKTCPSKKWTPIFTCDTKCDKALTKGCDDNDNWMAIPKPKFSRAKCGDVYTICANGKQTTGYVRDSSVTKTRYEVSPGIQKALDITVGASFKGAVYKPGAKQSIIDKDRCCKNS